jgi:shikimate kinase
MAKLIFIVGFMGSGKSTLGKKLAQAFDADFIDLDQAIEQKEQKTINEIFEQHGEEYFRELESQTLRNIHSEKLCFVATGGGTPCFHGNIQWMKNNGVVIYLNLPAYILTGRLKTEKAHRPLLKNLSDTELSDYVNRTLEKRAYFYEMADIIVPHNKNFTMLKTELNFLLLDN